MVSFNANRNKHMTKKAMYQLALEKLGYSVDPNYGWKYDRKHIKMSRPDQVNSYFIGKGGGLRYGRIISDSIGVADSSRAKLIRIAKG
jgi:hypothetical protein